MIDSALILANPYAEAARENARAFCADFLASDGRPRFILGRNVYAESVATQIPIDGFIDDFTQDATYLGRPIHVLNEVPADALVLVAAGGRPLSARAQVAARGLQQLDYFAFLEYSGLPLKPVVFNEGFADEFRNHVADYERIYERLADETSRETFRKLVNFRLTHDIHFLEGFSSREEVQYFENFLELAATGERFVDIGGFNGFTSLEFIRRCPGYESIEVFEPEPENYRTCIEQLRGHANVTIHPLGLSAAPATLWIEPSGSGSRISDQGTVAIEVARLDDVLADHPTFIKMDIEGAELDAIGGMRETIGTCRPKLALSVYHAAGDFWRIPDAIFAIRDDYRIYLRHYTESIYETVMFFVPDTLTPF